MVAKTTGAKLKAFFRDQDFWPDDDESLYLDDANITVSKDKISPEASYYQIPDDAVVTIEGGIVFGDKFNNNEPTLETYFKRWKKAQTAKATQTFSVTCKKDDVLTLKALIKTGGGKIT